MFNKKPSDRYQAVLDLHATAHRSGLIRQYEDGSTTNHTGDKIFEGSEICTLASEVQQAATMYRCKHMLDFGCGKAKGYYYGVKAGKLTYRSIYDLVGIDPASVFLYDPGVPEFAQPPRKEQTFDLVVCTDVLEHIPEEDTDMVLDYLFEKCNKAMVLSISCQPALAILQDGTNAHVNVKPPEWWEDKLKDRLAIKPIYLYADMAFTDPADGRGKCRIFKSV